MENKDKLILTKLNKLTIDKTALTKNKSSLRK